MDRPSFRGIEKSEGSSKVPGLSGATVGSWRRWSACLIALSLIVAACGNGDNGDEDTVSDGNEDTAPGEFDDEVVEAWETYTQHELPGIDVETVQAAKDEGSMVLYASVVPAHEAMFEAFEDRYPFVQLENIAQTGGALNERFASEQRAGQHNADVFATSSQADVFEFVDEGFCSEYVPASDDLYPPDSKIPGYAYTWQGALHGIAFVDGTLDSDEMSALNSTWDTLADERWEGKFWGWLDVEAGGTTLFNNTYLYLEHGTEIWDRHVELAGGVNIYGGTNPVAADLLRGEIDLSGPGGISIFYNLWDAGAPIAWGTPRPLLSVPAAGCIAEGSPNPNAARLYWEFMLSELGQQLMVPYGAFSYRSGLDMEAALPERLLEEEWFSVPEEGEVYEISVDELVEIREEMVEAWRESFEN